MKWCKYILIYIFRKKLRSFLTISSIAVALFLFCFLEAINGMFQQGVDTADVRRLLVQNATSMIMPIDKKLAPEIRQLPEVEKLATTFWFGGIYQGKPVPFQIWAIEPETFLAIYSEYELIPQAHKSFVEERSACIMGAAVAREYGWKIGDRIVLTSTIHPGQWEFVVRGIFTGSVNQYQMFIHYEYLSAKSEIVAGSASDFRVLLKKGAKPGQVCAKIDQAFATTATPTRTQSERAVLRNLVGMIGDVELLLRAVGFAVLFSILLIAANVMIMATREEIVSFGILKSLGFSDASISGLVLLESCLISLLGGGIGCFLAYNALTNIPLPGMFPPFLVTPATIATALGISMGLGIVSGLIPAWQSAKLKVVAAFAHVK